MTSKLTRERLQEIAEDGFLKHGESKELARLALSCQESEPVAWTDEQCLEFLSIAFRHAQVKGDLELDDIRQGIRIVNNGVAAENGNYPVIPDGWALVPVEPTEDMIIQGFESAPDEFFSPSDVWEDYQKMSGCQQAAHRAKLCWAAMIAAAPQEVKSASAIKK